MDITRRKFLELSTKMAAMMGLGATAIPKIAEAMEQLSAGNAPVLWLQGQSCSGCSVSLLNSEEPGPAQILTGYISLLFHSTISASTGDVSMQVLNSSIDHGGYLLVVEGSVPAGMPEACVVGGELFTKQLLRAARNAKAVIAVGTCATFGGIPAAENNPTGAESVPDFLKKNGISKPLIRIPGCPAHPDWIVGTLVHVLKFGIPQLDKKGRPKMFFSKLIHDQCPRFADYERENFAKTFSEDGCLFMLGCLGPLTHADCTLRLWNSGTNSCIKAGAPCIGCASEDFAASASVPFYRKTTLSTEE
ncbi:MAG: hydrogenase small subunit [Thermodesulfobacteriota bacterium]|nr:hydrogenase small subunit [Thermodesulfobacteriota bacterium]